MGILFKLICPNLKIFRLKIEFFLKIIKSIFFIMKKNQKRHGFTEKEWNNMSPIRKLERKLDRVNHIMELIRTVVPIMLLLLNTIIILKLFNYI